MRIGIPLCILLTALPCIGQDDTCDGNTYEVSTCLSKVQKRVDAELNTVYQQALKVATDSYTPQDVQNLKDAERKWIAYRDAVCKAELGLWGNGTGGPATYMLCLIRIAKQRITDLQEAYIRKP